MRACSVPTQVKPERVWSTKMSRRTRRPLVYEDGDDDTLFGYIKTNPKRYLLPKAVYFGYHKDHRSNEIMVIKDGMEALKDDDTTEKLYGQGMVYSAIPLRGTAEFEITLTAYGSRWQGNFKLGIVHYPTGKPLDNSKIPAHSSEGYNNCVWCSHKVHDRIERGIEMPYGHLKLDVLREGDRLGLQITKDGILSFYVNDEYQGIALTDVYKEGVEVYAFVDHYGKAKGTRITKAIMRDDNETTLQEYCLDKIASVLKSKDDIEKLSIPEYLRERLKPYVYPS